MHIRPSWQWCGVATLSVAMLYAGALPAGVGYLPRIGPGPLRFHSAAKADASLVLQPLKMSDESTNAPIELGVNTNEPPSEIQVSDDDFQLLPPPPFAPPTDVLTNAPPFPEGVMVPQMLLRYFTRGTNQPQALLSAPLEFYPPPPPLTRSSAVYISK